MVAILELKTAMASFIHYTYTKSSVSIHQIPGILQVTGDGVLTARADSCSPSACIPGRETKMTGTADGVAFYCCLLA